MHSKYELWMQESYGWRVVDWGDDLEKLKKDANQYKKHLGRDCKIFAVLRFEQPI